MSISQGGEEELAEELSRTIFAMMQGYKVEYGLFPIGHMVTCWDAAREEEKEPLKKKVLNRLQAVGISNNLKEAMACPELTEEHVVAMVVELVKEVYSANPIND